MRDRTSALSQRLSTIAGGPLPGAEDLDRKVLSRRYKPGEHLFHQGDADGHVRLVICGLVKLVYEDAKGRAFTKSIVEGGDIFASMAALAGEGASFSAVALTAAEVEQAPWSELQRQAARHHAWETASRRLFMDYARRKEAREFEFLTLSAAERWTRLTRERPALVQAAPQAELAALIGVTPVGLSRLKARLRRCGLGD
ncbi:MAG: Crp/Fnr family transcriptional regulator [Phenylobacterium sp.]|uniref:Crp/Fnr family transcriptional regulator n=1 Tax=Phenylobacterium sp. TaxID=1871053 RepID=UPI001A5B8A3E|nr:Crp/Fnr family transcriptional regulator [Phenylobacterium sp.]MBL8772672.1 Crp/Fnr family transcriptional regulator [Phenylobacterium sp.]